MISSLVWTPPPLEGSEAIMTAGVEAVRRATTESGNNREVASDRAVITGTVELGVVEVVVLPAVLPIVLKVSLFVVFIFEAVVAAPVEVARDDRVEIVAASIPYLHQSKISLATN